MEQELSDEVLMNRYLEGDTRAFQELLGRHGRKIHNFILRHTGDRQLAEDLTQDTFLRVVHRADTFRRQARFTTWLYTIARNLCIDHGRRAKHRRHLALDAPLRADERGGATLLDRVEAPDPLPDSQARDHRFRDALQAALGALPVEQREVFVMREYDGLKFREIAEVVGVPENTIKSRMRYALQGLREALAEFEETIR